MLNFQSEYQNILTEVREQISASFPKFIYFQNQKLSLFPSNNLSSFSQLVLFLDLSEDVTNFIFPLLINGVLPAILQTNSKIEQNNFVLTLETVSIPHSRLSIAIIFKDFFQLIINFFIQMKIDLSDQNQQLFAKKCHDIYSLITPSDLKDDMSVKILSEIFDLASMKNDQVILDECRTLIIKGEAFGDAVHKFMVSKKGNIEGRLFELSQLACVIWKNDLLKLQKAIDVLVAIGGSEVLESLLLFESTIKKKKNEEIVKSPSSISLK